MLSRFFTIRKRSYGKVMFLLIFVCPRLCIRACIGWGMWTGGLDRRDVDGGWVYWMGGCLGARGSVDCGCVWGDVHPKMITEAGSMYPTGMHSCSVKYVQFILKVYSTRKFLINNLITCNEKRA